MLWLVGNFSCAGKWWKCSGKYPRRLEKLEAFKESSIFSVQVIRFNSSARQSLE